MACAGEKAEEAQRRAAKRIAEQPQLEEPHGEEQQTERKEWDPLTIIMRAKVDGIGRTALRKHQRRSHEHHHGLQ